jgi:putative restriction endonuclease
MRVVAPGDLIVSFQGTYLRNLGVALTYCYESPKPEEFERAGLYWNRIGWRVDVRWAALSRPVRPADHMQRLRGTLPEKYAPLRASGEGLQSVYLAEVPVAMMRVLAELVGPELQVPMARTPEPLPLRIHERPEAAEQCKQAWENHLEGAICADAELSETERTALVRSRRGQGVFRDRVRSVERACRITRVDNPEHLIASHCKPWRHANNEERLDGENGLLLTPTIDHLFDRGFISFEDDGRLLISPVADKRSMQKMGITTDARVDVGAFAEGQRRYLDYHRGRIFLELQR